MVTKIILITLVCISLTGCFKQPNNDNIYKLKKTNEYLIKGMNELINSMTALHLTQNAIIEEVKQLKKEQLYLKVRGDK